MTTRKPAVKGSTPEERRTAREQRREHNRVSHITARAQQARNGRELLVVACNAAQAVGSRLTDTARRNLAAAIAKAVEQADTPANRKAQQ